MSENLLKIQFPKKINENTKILYENLLCHKIFVEERLETLNTFHEEKDVLKYTIHKGLPVDGDLRVKLSILLNNINDENWNAVKGLMISSKKTTEEVWNDYVNSKNLKDKISGDLLLFAIKFAFDNEIKGYKSRLKNTLIRMESIKRVYPNIENEINLNIL